MIFIIHSYEKNAKTCSEQPRPGFRIKSTHVTLRWISMMVLASAGGLISAAERFLDAQFEVSLTSNITYPSTVGSTNNTLDLYQPIGMENNLRPGFIILHGYGGDKATDKFVDLSKMYTRRGYACASINYDDLNGRSAADAVRWMKSNASKYHIDPKRIVIGGGSGGSYVAMQEAYSEADGVGANAEVRAVLDLWGPMQPVPFLHPSIPSLVDSNDPPVFIAHGDADTTVSIDNSITFSKRLKAVGVPYKFYKITGGDHGCMDLFLGNSPDPAGTTKPKTFDRYCAEFFYRQLDLANIPIGPAITSQPKNVTVIVGQKALFSVKATGKPAPTYQWKRNGVSIPGATGAVLEIAVTLNSDNGAKFTCVVSNSSGTVTSGAATLTVMGSSPDDALSPGTTTSVSG